MTPSINGIKISSDLAVLVTSSILSFGIIKVSPFLALTDPRTLILFSNLSITDEAVLVANLVKTFLAKGSARSISLLVFLP